MKRILIILLLAVAAFPAFAQMGTPIIIPLWPDGAPNDNGIVTEEESGLQGWIDCYEKSALKAHLFCGGVNNPREINGNPKLQEAFELGKNV